ncbi:MAG TPA: helix-turn-helix transcriptional regulator, partial [Nitrospirota bacterium]|nr:helix-turn-helix transcriptional regulator [Nitrospirota bacterium]
MAAKSLVYQEIGKRIRELRGGSRQKDWATRIGCDQGYISQVENGVTKPSLSFLKGIASITNASIDWVLTGRGDKFGCAQVSYDYSSAGEQGGDTFDMLKRNPKLLMAVDKLLRMDDKGRSVLEALYEMDESRIEGL